MANGNERYELTPEMVDFLRSHRSWFQMQEAMASSALASVMLDRDPRAKTVNFDELSPEDQQRYAKPQRAPEPDEDRYFTRDGCAETD